MYELADIQFRSEATEFVAPYSIGECVRRLNQQHEAWTLFAWKGAMRTTVQLRQVDDYTVEFKLRRVGKSSLLPNVGSSALIHGQLEALDSSHTQVTARIETLHLWNMLGIALFVVIAVIWAVAVPEAAGWVLVFLLVLGPATIFGILWQRQKLVTVFKHTFRPYL